METENTEQVVTEKKVTSKKKIKGKDIVIIGILSVVLIAIIVLLINNSSPSGITGLIGLGGPKEPATGGNIPSETQYTEEEFMAIAEEIEYELNKEIISAQLKIFEGWYSELGIAKEEMNICLAKNDFSEPDTDFENAEVLKKIIEDYSVASQIIGFQGTPGILVNGYKFDGYVPFETLKTRIDAALWDVENNIPLIDYADINKTTYEYNSEKEPVLYIIYNKNHAFAKEDIDNFISSTQQSEYSGFFTKVFDLPTEHINYLEAPQNIEDLMAVYNLSFTPLLFIEGDISKAEFTEEEMQIFNQFFYTMPEGGYISPYAISHYTDYTFLQNENDYIIGSEDAKVTLFIFSDYACAYCKLFEEEVVPQVMEEYVEKGLVNIVVKDFVIYQEPSLFPTIFARCAQQQGKYYETNIKLFENNALFGNALIEEIITPYMERFEELQRQYEKLQQ